MGDGPGGVGVMSGQGESMSRAPELVRLETSEWPVAWDGGADGDQIPWGHRAVRSRWVEWVDCFIRIGPGNLFPDLSISIKQ